MADSAVLFVIENNLQLLKDESKLRFAEEEVKSLIDQLKRIRCSTEVPVDGIRDLAYKAEDVIDKYLSNCIASDMENKKGEKLGRIFHRFSNPTTKRRVRIEIEDIRLKMGKIFENRSVGTSHECLANRGKSAAISEGTHVVNTDDVTGKLVKIDPTVEEADVVGFDIEAKNLVEWLLKGGDSLAVKSIVGIGGLGKTTLAKKAYNDFQVIKYFERCRAWVYVSKECSHTELLLNVINNFTKVTDQTKEKEDDELGKLLRSCLKSKRYLIVLDDLWNPELLKYLEAFFPDDKNGSRVLITTRDDMHVNQEHLAYRDDNQSWELLRKQAFGDESCPPDLEELGKEISKKCDGLPLAIAVLGGVLSTKEKTTVEWQKVAEVLSSFPSEREKKCSEILAYSYKDLPISLKCCFLYFAAYPEDFEIPAKQLIRLWIAEGLVVVKAVDEGLVVVKAVDGASKTVEETAEWYLNKLIDRGLIQVIKRRSDGGVKTCAIQDLLRDLCISEAKKERFLQFHDEKANSSISPRRLAGKSSVMRYIYSNPSSMKELRSVLCFTEDIASFEVVNYLTTIFKSFQFIRVLNLDGVAFSALPEEIGGLYLLKYLGLGKTSITSLPRSICKLLFLQTLCISSSFIESAPPGIWKMTELRHVYSQNQTLLPAPKDDASLGNLQTLTTICPSSCTVDVLSKLPNLVKLGVFGDLHSHADKLWKGLLELKHLTSLKLKRPWTMPPLVRLPSELPANLIKVTLCDTELKENPMEQLGQLMKLRILKLTNKSFVQPTLKCCSEKFPSLEVLNIMNLQQHKFELKIEERALPKLQSLVLRDCYGLQKLPEELWRLSNLGVVVVSEPSEPLRRVLRHRQQVRSGCKIYVYPPEKQ